MKYRTLKISPLLVASAFLFFTVPSFALQVATECSSDADCGDGGICQKDMWTNGCSTPEAGETEECDTTVYESETGFCYFPPEQCESDADCDEYLSCVQGSSGSCTSGPNGETQCTEARSPSYCSMVSVECESDADCPRDFECAEVATLCLDIACPEDEPDCGRCDSEGSKECRPQEVECESDADCPSEWSCLGTVSYECPDESSPPPVDSDEGGGEGSEGSEAMDRAAPAPGGGSSGMLPEEDNQDVPQCVEVPAVGSCYPDSWSGDKDLAGDGGSVVSGSGGSVASSDEDRAEKPPTEEGVSSESAEESESSESGGCSVATSSPRSASWWLALLLVLPALRRRQTAAPARTH